MRKLFVKKKNIKYIIGNVKLSYHSEQVNFLYYE